MYTRAAVADATVMTVTAADAKAVIAEMATTADADVTNTITYENGDCNS